MRRPQIDSNFETNVRGLFVIGDLAGASVLKLAMEQGCKVAAHIASKPDARGGELGVYDVIVAGAGAAGLSAALEAQARGLRVLLLEKDKVASTIEDFPEGKRIYAEPEGMAPPGRLWIEDTTKEDLLARWQRAIAESGLEVHAGEGLTALAREKGGFRISTPRAVYRARYVILSTGVRGNPRRLGVPGEDGGRVHHCLYSPKDFTGEDILVVGGGNSAVEAALALAGQNRVTLSYRGTEFTRIFKENRRKLDEAVRAGAIRVMLQSGVKRFEDNACVLNAAGEETRVACRRAFVLIGAEPPADFLRSLGIRLENEWNARRFALLALTFLTIYTISAVRPGDNLEMWPFRGWGHSLLAWFGRPWTFWYGVLFTAVMTLAGIGAVKRWGFDRKDSFQIKRYASLIGFQWVFFFLIPEFLFRWVVDNPVLAGQAWRSYGIVYAWPLFFHTFIDSPHVVWIVWGAILSFVLMPVLALYHGKRYCSWICGCGGLAETLGDPWRHLAPKGRASIRWERMNQVVLAAAVLTTLLAVAGDAWHFLRQPAMTARAIYHFTVDTWLVAIIPLTLYPFLGGKIWCRYWCPLAKMMELFSKAFTRFKASRFAIHANEKCIACGECTRYCQVGIDVMSYAMKQHVLDNSTSSCIGCGICVTVCPMDVLSFRPAAQPGLVQIRAEDSATLGVRVNR